LAGKKENEPGFRSSHKKKEWGKPRSCGGRGRDKSRGQGGQLVSYFVKGEIDLSSKRKRFYARGGVHSQRKKKARGPRTKFVSLQEERGRGKKGILVSPEGILRGARIRKRRKRFSPALNKRKKKINPRTE